MSRDHDPTQQLQSYFQHRKEYPLYSITIQPVMLKQGTPSYSTRTEKPQVLRCTCSLQALNSIEKCKTNDFIRNTFPQALQAHFCTQVQCVGITFIGSSHWTPLHNIFVILISTIGSITWFHAAHSAKSKRNQAKHMEEQLTEMPPSHHGAKSQSISSTHGSSPSTML